MMSKWELSCGSNGRYIPEHQLQPPQSVNSIEQLCINLCNERLQNLFVKIMFEGENKFYQSEGHLHFLFSNEFYFRRFDFLWQV